MVCAVVGFPLGAMAPTAKAYEAREAVAPGRARDRHGDQHRRAQVERLRDRVRGHLPGRRSRRRRRGVKVILETSALTHEEKIIGCALSKLARRGVREDVDRVRQGRRDRRGRRADAPIVGNELGVKASGGVRTAEDAMKMAQAGANRIGATASVAIVTGTTATARRKGY